MALTKISTGMLKQDAASSDLNIDAGTLFLDVSNNRVGIANTSPSQAFDVTGNAVFSGSVTSTGLTTSGNFLKTGTNGNYTIAANGNDFYYGRNGTNYHIANTANGAFQFLTGSSSTEALRITSAQHVNIANGKLGIGFTSTPDTALHVETSADTILKVEKTGGNYIQLHGTGAGGRIKSDAQINFDVGSNSGALNLASNGNATFTGSVTAGGLKLDGGTLSHASSNASSITISGGSNSTNGMNMSLGGSSGSLSQSVVWKQNSSEKMRIDSSGNLLVGTTDTTLWNDNADNYGHNILSNGQYYSSTNGEINAYLNRQNSDGAILAFAKDGTTVGSIFNSGTTMGVGSLDTGVLLANNIDAILPWNASTNAERDAAIDLGRSIGRFRNLHLSGTANIVGTAGRGLVISNATESYTNNVAVLNAQHSQGILQFKTASAERMRITKDGNVGIGTTAPGSFVESSRFVVGSGTSGTNEMMFLYSGTNTFGAIGFADGTSGTARYKGIIGYHHTGDEMFFSTNGGGEADRDVTITSAGNVGIGVSSTYSGAKLSVAGSTVLANGNQFVIGTFGTSGLQLIGTAGGDNVVGTMGSSEPLLFRTASTERMRIDSSGNVGIGTTAVTDPGLWYDATNDYLAISHWATPPTPAAMLHLSDNSNNLDIPQIRIEGRENPGDTKLDIAVKDPQVRFNLVENSTDAAGGYGQMIFKTNAAANTTHPTRGGFKFETPAQSSNLVITNTGNVGIGTDSPGELLSLYKSAGTTLVQAAVHANSTVGFEIKKTNATTQTWRIVDGQTVNGVLEFYDATNSATRMAIKGDGKVGIGTASPAQTLHVSSTGATSNGIRISNSEGSFETRVDQGEFYLYDVDDNRIPFLIDTSGNVGIGTTNPYSGTGVTSMTVNAANYPVVSLKRADGHVFQILGYYNHAVLNASVGWMQFDAGGSERMRIDSSGNVGIGTGSTAPSHLLDILKTGSGDATINIKSTTGGDPTIIFNSAAANRSGLIKYQDNGTNVGRIEYVHNGDRIDFQAGSATGATMSVENGKVGIGLTNPSSPLHVSAAKNDGWLAQLINTGTGSDANGLDIHAGVDSSDYILRTRHQDGTDAMAVKYGGKVGIGTTSPAAPLDVGYADNSNIFRASYKSSEDNFFLELDSSILGSGVVGYQFHLKNNGTSYNNMLTFDRGNVGIGTASPSAEVPLTAVYNSTSQFHFGGAQAGISNNVYYNGSQYTNRNTGAGGALLQLGTDGSFAFRRATSGSSPTLNYSMYIDGTGKVGIGQTAFGVNGNLQVTGGISTTGNSEIRQSTNSDGSTLRFLGTQFVAGPGNSHSYAYSGGGLIASVSPSAGAIMLDVGANSTSGHRLKVVNAGNGIAGSLQYLSGTTSRFHVDSSSGRVGIGTNTPGSLLTIYNDSTSGNTQLHVHNDKTGDAAVLRLEGKRTSTNDNAQILFANNGSIGSTIRAYSSGDNGDIRFYTSATGTGNTTSEALRITTAGDISVISGKGLYFGGSNRSSSTNSQAYIKESGLNLDIKGNDNVRLLGDGGNIILHADYTGDVGIGTTSPKNPKQRRIEVTPTTTVSSNAWSTSTGNNGGFDVKNDNSSAHASLGAITCAGVYNKQVVEWDIRGNMTANTWYPIAAMGQLTNWQDETGNGIHDGFSMYFRIYAYDTSAGGPTYLSNAMTERIWVNGYTSNSIQEHRIHVGAWMGHAPNFSPTIYDDDQHYQMRIHHHYSNSTTDPYYTAQPTIEILVKTARTGLDGTSGKNFRIFGYVG